MLLLIALFLYSSIAQTWSVQRHYSTSGCAGNTYSEAAANGGTGACTSSFPCGGSTTLPSDFVQGFCTGTAPSLIITNGLRFENYVGLGCQPASLLSVLTYTLNVCVSLPTASIMVVCSQNNGATRMLFNDRFCASFNSNLTLTSGPANTCNVTSTSPPTTSGKYTCGAGGPIISHGSSLVASSAMTIITVSLVLLFW